MVETETNSSVSSKVKNKSKYTVYQWHIPNIFNFLTNISQKVRFHKKITYSYIFLFINCLSHRGPNSGSARTTTPAITHRTAVPSTPTTGTTTAATNQSTPSAGLSTPQNTISTTTPSAPIVKARTETNNDATPPTSTGASTGSSSSGRPIQLSDLQNFLQGITPPGGRQDQSGKIISLFDI